MWHAGWLDSVSSLKRGVCAIVMAAASPGKGPGSLFLFVFDHYSFPLTLFSLRTQGGLHVAEVLSSFFLGKRKRSKSMQLLQPVFRKRKGHLLSLPCIYTPSLMRWRCLGAGQDCPYPSFGLF